MTSPARHLGVLALLVAVLPWLFQADGAGAQTGAPAGRPALSPDGSRALVDRYCLTCHGQRAKAGGLVLEGLDAAAADQHPAIWEKVIRKVDAGLMPPATAPRPSSDDRAQFVTFLERSLDRAAQQTPNAGRTESLHRLNRAEYRNAVRDLFALDVDVAELLPTDDASYGFDNMAGVLKLNQSMLENYLSAAKTVSRMALGLEFPVAGSRTYHVSSDRSQYQRAADLPLGTRGGTVIRHYFLQNGEYEFKIKLLCHIDNFVECDGSLGFREAHQLELTIDGERVKVFDLRPRRMTLSGPTGGGHNPTSLDGEIEPLEIRVPVEAGPHDVGVAFVQTAPMREVVRGGFRQRLERPYRYYADAMAIVEPFLERVTINGPFNAAGPGDTLSRRRILTCRPRTAAEEDACAERIVAGLTRRAFRRPVSQAEVRHVLEFYTQARRQGDAFEAAVGEALRGLLVMPAFLFRVEQDPPGRAAGRPYRLGALELASRLSFFLWSSIPDDALLAAAASGALRQPSEIERQVRRMLADPRANALVENFVGQWLRLRSVERATPYEGFFPNFDDTLRESMRRETELFVEHVFRQDRSVTELVTADYSFLNERLARHYGIKNVRGSHFRRVTFGADVPRRGLLGQASILTVTSLPNRTSPVKRGAWILETMLGVTPPPPPANVPPLEEEPIDSRTVLSMRDRMARHRKNPVCASCHGIIDPIGFALEQFDATGAWRTTDGSFKPIDPSGGLPDGTKFGNLTDFQAALARRPEHFVTAFTEKLLTYALGRGLESFDQPAIRRIVRDAARDNYRFSSVVVGVVTSLPFQNRMPVGD